MVFSSHFPPSPPSTSHLQVPGYNCKGWEDEENPENTQVQATQDIHTVYRELELYCSNLNTGWQNFNILSNFSSCLNFVLRFFCISWIFKGTVNKIVYNPPSPIHINTLYNFVWSKMNEISLSLSKLFFNCGFMV